MCEKGNFEVKTFRVGLLFFLLPILAKVETLIKVLGTIFYSSYIPLLSGSRKFFESLIFSTVVVAEKVESNFCVGKREKEAAEGFLIIFLLHTIHQRLCLLVNYIFDALQTTQVQPTIIPKGFHIDPASVAAAPSIYLPPILTLEASISSLDQGCPNF